MDADFALGRYGADAAEGNIHREGGLTRGLDERPDLSVGPVAGRGLGRVGPRVKSPP
jgi:hypothetical protein